MKIAKYHLWTAQENYLAYFSIIIFNCFILSFYHYFIVLFKLIIPFIIYSSKHILLKSSGSILYIEFKVTVNAVPLAYQF